MNSRRRVNSTVMPLPLKLKRYTFLICFAVVFLPFLALNLVSYIAARNCCEGDSIMEAGFPLTWWISGWAPPRIIWNAFIADLLLAIVASVIGAKVLTSVFQPTR